QAQHELGGLLRGKVAGVIAFHQLVVQALGFHRVACAAGAGKEVSPLVIAVQRQQSMVQVEQSQVSWSGHALSSGDVVVARRSFKSGKVMARCFSSEYRSSALIRA